MSYLDSRLHTEVGHQPLSPLRTPPAPRCQRTPTCQVPLLRETAQLVFVLCTTTVVSTRTIQNSPHLHPPSPFVFPEVKYNCEGFEEVPDNIAHFISAQTIPKLPESHALASKSPHIQPPPTKGFSPNSFMSLITIC